MGGGNDHTGSLDEWRDNLCDLAMGIEVWIDIIFTEVMSRTPSMNNVMKLVNTLNTVSVRQVLPRPALYNVID